MSNFVNLDKKGKTSVLATLFGYLKEVENNKFTEKMEMSQIANMLYIENPTVEKNEKGTWHVSFDNFDKVLGYCYDTVHPDPKKRKVYRLP